MPDPAARRTAYRACAAFAVKLGRKIKLGTVGVSRPSINSAGEIAADRSLSSGSAMVSMMRGLRALATDGRAACPEARRWNFRVGTLHHIDALMDRPKALRAPNACGRLQ